MNAMPRRWLLALLAGTFACLLWFAYLNRDGCWLYSRGLRGLLVFVIPWVWIVLLVGLKMKGRAVLLTLTAVGVLLWPHVDVLHVAAAEASAVGTLRHMQTALGDLERERRAYPDTVAELPTPFPVQRFYLFGYEPVREPDGAVKAYVLTARPVRRSRNCGCARSFAMNADGQVHYTLEDRPATLTDNVLE
jgi:hypothetical protein